MIAFGALIAAPGNFLFSNFYGMCLTSRGFPRRYSEVEALPVFHVSPEMLGLPLAHLLTIGTYVLALRLFVPRPDTLQPTSAARRAIWILGASILVCVVVTLSVVIFTASSFGSAYRGYYEPAFRALNNAALFSFVLLVCVNAYRRCFTP